MYGRPAGGICGFSPSVVVLKVNVVKLWVTSSSGLLLVESFWDVTLLVEILWSDLGDVHVDQIGIVGINVQHLVSIVSVNVNWVLNMEVFMWKNHMWMTMLVSRSFHIENLQIPVFFLLIDLEEEVFPGNYLVVGLCS